MSMVLYYALYSVTSGNRLVFRFSSFSVNTYIILQISVEDKIIEIQYVNIKICLWVFPSKWYYFWCCRTSQLYFCNVQFNYTRVIILVYLTVLPEDDERGAKKFSLLSTSETESLKEKNNFKVFIMWETSNLLCLYNIGTSDN